VFNDKNRNNSALLKPYQPYNQMGFCQYCFGILSGEKYRAFFNCIHRAEYSEPNNPKSLV